MNFRISQKKILYLIVALIIILASGFWIGIDRAERYKNGVMLVAFLDVGQGDAIFIETPNGKQVLIDGGVGNKVLSALGQVMPFYDRKIDLLIATHNDADHIGGFPEVFKRYKIISYGDNGKEESGDLIDALDRAINAERLESKMTLKSGNEVVLDLERNIRLEILWPAGDFECDDRNDCSVVARLVYGNSEFLLTGDAPILVEDYLINGFGYSSTTESVATSTDSMRASTSNILESDILKVGHHGSDTSTGEAFLKMVKPKYAIISAGADNKYGHPKLEVIEKLMQNQVEILETSKRGNIVFETDGEKLWLAQ